MSNTCRHCREPIIENPDVANRWLHKTGEETRRACPKGGTVATPVLREQTEAEEVKRLRSYRDEGVAVLKALTDDTLADIVRRARFDPRDGFPGAAAGVSDVHGGRAGSPVEERVAAQAGGTENPPTPDTWQSEPDPVAEAIAEIRAGMAEVAGICSRISRKRQYVEHAKDAARQEYRGLPRCSNPNCDDFADEGRGGRCDACWQYRRTHDGVDAPAVTIERRVERRRKAS